MTEPHFSRRLLGYDRAEVDAFVERTATRLADAQKPYTPDEAVQVALDRLGEETSAILKQAHAIADELTARSRQEAETVTTRSRQEADALTTRSQQAAAEVTARAQEEAAARLQQAEHEAAEIRQGAEARVTELDAEIDSLWQERQQLLDDIERISEQFHALASGAKERFPAEETEAEGVEDTPDTVVDETPGAVVVARDDAS